MRSVCFYTARPSLRSVILRQSSVFLGAFTLGMGICAVVLLSWESLVVYFMYFVLLLFLIGILLFHCVPSLDPAYYCFSYCL